MRPDAGASPMQTLAYTGICDNGLRDCQIFLMQYGAGGEYVGSIIVRTQKSRRRLGANT
jgi:hypothetical protein